MHNSLLLEGARVSFFEGALSRKGMLGRATTRPNQEATTRLPIKRHLPDPIKKNYQSRGNLSYRSGVKADHVQHNQGGFRSVNSAKGIITVTRREHSSEKTACVHTSWWQTSPICLQLALSDKG